MRFPPIDLQNITRLPLIYRAEIPRSFEDRNGHMNVRWYLNVFDEAGDALYPLIGLTDEYLARTGEGGFDLEHHLWYLSEVHVGDQVAVHVRLVGRSVKLFHYLMFLMNETRGTLASVFECVHAHADLSTRKTTTLPAHTAAEVDKLIAQHKALDWPAPVSGSMSVG